MCRPGRTTGSRHHRMGPEKMIATDLLLAAAAFGLVFCSTVVTGLIAMWAIGAATQSREPAFAGFCVAVGWAMGGRGVPRDGTTLQNLAVLLGVIGALLLLWRYRVRPERLGSEADTG